MNVLDFKKRSVGHLPAPRADAELVEKLATSGERAAVVKYLRLFASHLSMRPALAQVLTAAADDIENGEHIK